MSFFFSNCWLYILSNTSMISSNGMVAYSWTYCGRDSSRLNPAFFMKNGCITSGVASPSCLIVSLSIRRSLGLNTRVDEGCPETTEAGVSLGGGDNDISGSPSGRLEGKFIGGSVPDDAAANSLGLVAERGG